MSDRHEWVDEALRVAAAEDSRTIVPAHLEARVMRVWDERETGGNTSAHRRSRRAAWTAAGVAAACAVAFVLPRSRQVLLETHSEEQQLPAQHQASSVPAAAAPVVVRPDTQVDTSPPQAGPTILASRSERGGTRREPGTDVDRPATEFVLIPDPPVETAALQVVRVRMSRTAFASLGVPIENPDADGLMEVEMIVGDDGVARSIRRAAFVSHVDERGER